MKLDVIFNWKQTQYSTAFWLFTFENNDISGEQQTSAVLHNIPDATIVDPFFLCTERITPRRATTYFFLTDVVL